MADNQPSVKPTRFAHVPLHFKRWHGLDYRQNTSSGNSAPITELTIMTPWFQLRFVIPKFGVSLWRERDNHQVVAINYPEQY